MRHVRDRHPQPVGAAGRGFEADRVVEVARALAVDRDEGQVAQVLAVAQVLGVRVGRETGALRLDLRRKVDPQSVLERDREKLHVGILGIAEHLLEFAGRTAHGTWAARQPHHSEFSRIEGARFHAAFDRHHRQ